MLSCLQLLLVVFCFAGAGVSAVALYGEHRKWPSQAAFSVATKVPVELFCISGPIVLVTFTLYLLLMFLVVTCHHSARAEAEHLEDVNYSTCMAPVFYISAGWSTVYVDLCFALYSDISELFRQRFDMSLHAINCALTVLAFFSLGEMPWAFLLCGVGFWSSILFARIWRRIRMKRRPRLPSRELQKPSR